jgi:glycerate 2-kinase
MRILVAPNAFKGSINAREAGRAIADGLTGHDVRVVAMADGGDGTLDAFDPATYRAVSTVDAMRRPRVADISVHDGYAVVELARICGIAQVDEREPWTASSLGLGMAAKEAIAQGAHTVALALGGSASTDAGIGMLFGLGFRVLDQARFPVAPNLAGLLRAHFVDRPGLPEVRWVVLADTTAPLLGPHGAAHGFGPQKGLTTAACAVAEHALESWVNHVGGDPAIPGGGAAGGIGWTAAHVLGATIERGSDVIAERVGLAEQLRWADVVITGEGRFDAQSLSGKACGAVIEYAHRFGVPVVVIAGHIALAPAELRTAGIHQAIDLTDISGSVSRSLADPAGALTAAARTLNRTGTDQAWATLPI